MNQLKKELENALSTHPYYTRLQEELADHYEDAMHAEMLLGNTEEKSTAHVETQLGTSSTIITAMKEISSKTTPFILFSKAFFLSFLLLIWSQFLHSLILDNLLIFQNSGQFTFFVGILADAGILFLLGYLIVALFTLLYREFESRAYQKEILFTTLLLPLTINVLFFILIFIPAPQENYIMEHVIGSLGTLIMLGLLGYIGWKASQFIYTIQDEHIAGKGARIQKINTSHEYILVTVFIVMLLIQLIPFTGEFAKDVYPYIEQMQWFFIFPFQVVAFFVSLLFGDVQKIVHIYLLGILLTLFVIRHLKKAWEIRHIHPREVLIRLAITAIIGNILLNPIPHIDYIQWQVPTLDVAMTIEQTQFGPLTSITRTELGKEEGLAGFYYAAEKKDNQISVIQSSGYRFDITSIDIDKKSIRWSKKKDKRIDNSWALGSHLPRTVPEGFECHHNEYSREVQEKNDYFKTYIICHSLSYNEKEILTTTDWPAMISFIVVNEDASWAIIVLNRGAYDSNDVYAVALP